MLLAQGVRVLSRPSTVRGVILGYRRSKAMQYPNQVLIKVFTTPIEVHQFIGTKVVARDLYGNVYKGKILKIHSARNSVVLARFKPNIPGQLIGATVEIFKE